MARVLIARGAHVRNQPGDSIELHPVAEAVRGLEGYLNTRDLPDSLFNRPPRSTERYLAVIHVLLDAGADADALIVPSETVDRIRHRHLHRSRECAALVSSPDMRVIPINSVFNWESAAAASAETGDGLTPRIKKIRHQCLMLIPSGDVERCRISTCPTDQWMKAPPAPGPNQGRIL